VILRVIGVTVLDRILEATSLQLHLHAIVAACHRLPSQRAGRPSLGLHGTARALAVWKGNSDGRCAPVVGCDLDHYFAGAEAMDH